MPPLPLPVTTDRLLVRAFTPDDLDALHAIHSRPEVTPYLYWEPRSLDQTRAVLSNRTRPAVLEHDGDAAGLAVVRRDTGVLVGDVTVHLASAAHRQGEVGYVFHPDHHGRGFAVEGVAAVLRLLFGHAGLHRVVGSLDARNSASARVLERLGMRREAHFRQNEFVKGVWTDELVYAMLADEWRAGRHAAG